MLRQSPNICPFCHVERFSTKHLTSMKIKMFALRGNMTRKSKQATRQRKQKELSMRKQNKANQLSKIALWLLMFLPFFMVGVI